MLVRNFQLCVVCEAVGRRNRNCAPALASHIWPWRRWVIPSSVSLDHIYKIFGENPERALALLEQGMSKEDILAETRNVVGVEDVSFEVKPGEIFVVMGLSGSGKSTLIRCINRLYEPTSGTIKIDDFDVTAATDNELREIRRGKVSMVFQHFALFPHKSVQENVEYGLKVQKVAEAERRPRAEEALEMVGLGGWGSYAPSALSGGMRQRVGLARALASGSEVLLMDEAFSALDPLIKRDMQDELLNIHEKLGRTIIFITHDLNEALRLGERTAIMRDGRVEQIGSASQIINTPGSEYIHDFTRDVDRGRVLTLWSVMRPISQIENPDCTVDEALSHITGNDDACCIIMRDGEPERCISEQALRDAAAAGIKDCAEIGSPSQAAPQSTVLMDAFTAAAEGRCLTAVNRRGEVVGHADPSDVISALTQNEYSMGGAVADPLLSGWSASDIHVVANSDFLADNPAAKMLFEVMRLELATVAQQNNRMNQGEDSQADIERHVDEWIADNQATWDGWIDDAKNAA